MTERALRKSEPLPVNITKKLKKLSNTTELQGQLKCVNDIRFTTEQEYKNILRDNAKDSFSCYIEYMTPDEPPPPHIEWLSDRLHEVEQREEMRCLISMPPGHAKSKTCSRMFPSWYLGRNPDHKFLQGGHTQKFCEDQFGKPTRELIDSEDFQAVFPDVFLSRDTRGAGAWNLGGSRGGYVCKGVGQGISGYRGNMLVIDDPFATYEDSQNAGVREKVFQWYINDMAKRLLPFSPILIVATRWHPEDLSGRLLDMGGQGKGRPWLEINLPFEARPEWHEDGKDPIGRERGDLLWNYYADEFDEIFQTTDTHMYNSLYQGRPTTESGDLLEKSWIKRYTEIPRNVLNVSGQITDRRVKRITASLDAANKAKERTAFTVITVWLEDVEGNHYLLDVVREKVKFPQLLDLIDTTCYAHNVESILVEDQGAGIQYIQYMEENNEGRSPPCLIIPIETNNKSKEFRFDATTAIWQAGKVHLPVNAHYLPDYERELTEFPSTTFSDQVDSTSQYLEWSKPKTSSFGSKKLGR